MASKPLSFAASVGKPSPTTPIQGNHSDEDVYDVLIEAFGPLDCMADLVKRLGDSDSVGERDVNSIGYVLEALFDHGMNLAMKKLDPASWECEARHA